jgi:hypothetical protein
VGVGLGSQLGEGVGLGDGDGLASGEGVGDGSELGDGVGLGSGLGDGSGLGSEDGLDSGEGEESGLGDRLGSGDGLESELGVGSLSALIENALTSLAVGVGTGTNVGLGESGKAEVSRTKDETLSETDASGVFVEIAAARISKSAVVRLWSPSTSTYRAVPSAAGSYALGNSRSPLSFHSLTTISASNAVTA